MKRVTRKTLEQRIDQAMARVPADVVIKNVTLLNVATGVVFPRFTRQKLRSRMEPGGRDEEQAIHV